MRKLLSYTSVFGIYSKILINHTVLKTNQWHDHIYILGRSIIPALLCPQWDSQESGRAVRRIFNYLCEKV